MAHQLALRRSVWLTGTAILLVIAALTTGPGRNLAGRLLSSLRMQKVQAVNVDLSPFIDANANPTLHQMVAQMISDKVQVDVNESDQPAPDAAAASRLAGFTCSCSARARTRRKWWWAEHTKLICPSTARGCRPSPPKRGIRNSLCRIARRRTLAVQIPRAVDAQYGTCPGPTNATERYCQQHHRPDAGHHAV